MGAELTTFTNQGDTMKNKIIITVDHYFTAGVVKSESIKITIGSSSFFASDITPYNLWVMFDKAKLIVRVYGLGIPRIHKGTAAIEYLRFGK